MGQADSQPNHQTPSAPAEDVLSTLQHDGRRRWLRPRLAAGRWWHRRRAVAYALMVVFVVIPHLRLHGNPLILLDIVAREFTVLGRTFYPTDSLVLALLILSGLLTVVLVTAIAGRAWCGWACPQTVYMEFLFRPIDRLFEGTRGKGGNPRGEVSAVRQVARLLVYVALCMFLAHTFLAYFVGTHRLAAWVRSSPVEHPAAFLVMAATTGLMLFDFLYFREQLCTIACPYGRLQSTMLDEQSLIVAYDHVRGEPRRKGKRIAGGEAGNCVDCNQCVVVCPTGIDIRQGLQMECISCTQCIDACDSVMDRVGSPRGLIRFSSQDAIDRKPKRLVRIRTIAYPLILVAVLSGLAYALTRNAGFDARIIRGKGAPYSMLAGRQVSNAFSLRLVNRTREQQRYTLQMLQSDDVTVEAIETDALRLQPGESMLVPLQVQFPAYVTLGAGNRSATLQISDEAEHEQTVEFQILGPR